MFTRKKGKIKGKHGVGFFLWIVFFLFSLLVILVCEFSQFAILRQMQREEAVRSLRSVSTELKDNISLQSKDINLYLTSLSDRYNVKAEIISEDGYVLYPYTSEEAVYAAEMENVQLNADKDIYDTKDGSVFAYVRTVYVFTDKQPTTAYLYTSASAEISSTLLWGVFFQSVYVTIILLIVVTILSGLIASYVSKPITDLNEKAKKMNYGNLGVDFHSTNGAVYREVYELSDTLNFAESELSKADQMQKELIANVSHDFKTPLTMIKAYAAMIQDISGDNPEKRNKHAQIIIDESDRLASLVNDMLDLSKLRAGIDSLKISLFNLSDCLETVAGRFGYLTETEGYTFALDITENLFVEADKDKIAQVLYNLIGNAVNYTGENKRVAIRLFAENGVVHFTVTDTGKGIAPEEIDEIWERYYRSGETHKRPVKGTGLGLSIVKTILTKHNFNFGVRSEVGKGSTFYVDFPAKNVAELE
jgi:signal transduction histidine kinase